MLWMQQRKQTYVFVGKLSVLSESLFFVFIHLVTSLKSPIVWTKCYEMITEYRTKPHHLSDGRLQKLTVFCSGKIFCSFLNINISYD